MMTVISMDQNNGQYVQRAENTDMTPAEIKRYDELTGVVKENLKAFWAVGKALMEIRDEKLYRIEFDTFEDYCQGVLDISARSGYHQIAAAEVMENLRTMVHKKDLPANERQVRSLSIIEDPEEQRQAWRQVVERSKSDGVPITGNLVQSVVRKIQPPIHPPRPSLEEINRCTPEFKLAADAFLEHLRAAWRDDWQGTTKVHAEMIVNVARAVLRRE